MAFIDFVYPGGILISTSGSQSTNPLITALAGVIAGAIIGGVITYFVTDRTQKNRRLFYLRM